MPFTMKTSIPLEAALLDVRGAAQLLGTTERAIRHQVARQVLPFRRRGRRVIFLRAELENFINTLPGCSLEEAQNQIKRRQGEA